MYFELHAPISLFYIFGRNINDSNYYYYISLKFHVEFFCLERVWVTTAHPEFCKKNSTVL